MFLGGIQVSKMGGTVDTREQSTGVFSREGKGVKAYGQRRYPKGFLAPGIGGKWQVFSRKGKSRLPLTAEKIDVESAVRFYVPLRIREQMKPATERIRHEVFYRAGKAMIMGNTFGPVNGA